MAMTESGGTGRLARPAWASAVPLVQVKIFDEIEHIGLSDNWKEGSHGTVLYGDAAFDFRIFRQFELRFAPFVTLDFWFRGETVSPKSARAFRLALSYAHQISEDELSSLQEILGVVGETLHIQENTKHQIHRAQTGLLNGRMVILIDWENRKTKRKFQSVFIDARSDGYRVHELHFSTPAHRFDQYAASAEGLFSSIVWGSNILPPPLSFSH